MSRHQKNNCAGAVFTYHERQSLQHGTKKQRLGADSLKAFDSCCLCLHPVLEPMICPQGHLFCKECIYENLLAQKQDHKRQLSRWYKQQQLLKDETDKKEREDQDRFLQQFDHGVVPTRPHAGKVAVQAPAVRGTTVEAELRAEESVVKRHEDPMQERKRAMHAFWVPHMTPTATPTLLDKPSMETRCPEGTHIMRLKQLLALDFQKVKEVHERDPDGVFNARFECPACLKTLTNASKAMALRACGHVLCRHCIEKFVKSENKCFVCGKSTNLERDLLPIQAGGTGFAGRHGERLVATKYDHVATV